MNRLALLAALALAAPLLIAAPAQAQDFRFSNNAGRTTGTASFDRTFNGYRTFDRAGRPTGTVRSDGGGGFRSFDNAGRPTGSAVRR